MNFLASSHLSSRLVFIIKHEKDTKVLKYSVKLLPKKWLQGMLIGNIINRISVLLMCVTLGLIGQKYETVEQNIKHQFYDAPKLMEVNRDKYVKVPKQKFMQLLLKLYSV